MHAKSLLLYFDRAGLPTYLEQHKREPRRFCEPRERKFEVLILKCCFNISASYSWTLSKTKNPFSSGKREKTKILQFFEQY